ncbi:MAG: VTT domain-containing protein [Candidatus Sungbacteria bacterium]|uniref:VTT domain-containing protein n=1 Tax=Candidatus Sungiibacteriota bacterium TaxID=2750080 RepID=A0A9D6QVC8_9BACT|nr:VTT domain-containing protein [Candidatus Sungbacteria bacterium]
MFDLRHIIEISGYLGIFIIVFAESGLLIGFFLPGDSLLFTAGLLASQGYLSFGLLAFVAVTGAILGDSTGYWFGEKVGPRIFKREDSLFFKKKNLARAHAFYQQHGGKALVYARFMPVIRTLAPIVAGVGDMEYRKFILFNAIGGILWGLGLSFLGYYVGATIPNADNYLLLIIGAIVVISVAPPLVQFLRSQRN